MNHLLIFKPLVVKCFMHYCSFSVIWFLIPVSVYRFGELWILFMGVRVSESMALLRTCPPLSVKSAVAHANTNAHASVLLHGKITVTPQAEQCETSLAIQQCTLQNHECIVNVLWSDSLNFLNCYFRISVQGSHTFWPMNFMSVFPFQFSSN